jgi:hypothetical protein
MVNEHIAFCDSCFDDFVALAGPERIAEIIDSKKAVDAPKNWTWERVIDTIKRDESYWENVVVEQGNQVIEMARVYGPGTAISEGIRIVDENLPEEIERLLHQFVGTGFEDKSFHPGDKLFKIVETPVGSARCRIDLGIGHDGMLYCNVGSVRSPEGGLTVGVSMWSVDEESKAGHQSP